MARNRQRARDRKRRAAQEGGGGDGANLHAGEQPASTSGEVDELEAALATGAGEPADVDDTELEAQALQSRGDLDDDGDVDAQDAALAREVQDVVAPAPGRRAAAGPGGGPRFVQFIRGSWAELQRVQWPDRRQVGQATAVVIGFVIIAGAYLGIADWAAKKLVDFIL
jgi:preprotein translocase SecE subunit